MNVTIDELNANQRIDEVIRRTLNDAPLSFIFKMFRQKDIKVNGREYYFDGLLGKITTAQYIDFQNYQKNNDEQKSFSVFIIPKGHKYNDGYDIEQVFNDILDVPVPVLFSASFFLSR